jgi:transcriptional regulator with XRE-family HTH domain
VTARNQAHFRAALGRTIRELRHARDISQERLATIAAIDRSYTGGIERGERRATAEKVDQLLSAMDATWIEFAEELMRQVGKSSAGDAASRGATAAQRRSSRRAG